MVSLIIILVLLIPLAAVVLDSRLGQALARRVEGGAPDEARLRALESEVDRLGREVERIQEESQFLTRLLEERPQERPEGPPEGPPGPGPRSLPSPGDGND